MVNRLNQVLEKQCHFRWGQQSRWYQSQEVFLLAKSSLLFATWTQSWTTAPLPAWGQAYSIHSPSRKPTSWSHATDLTGQGSPLDISCPLGSPNHRPNYPNATMQQFLPSISQEVIFSQISNSEKCREVLKVLLEGWSLIIPTGMFTIQRNPFLLSWK